MGDGSFKFTNIIKVCFSIISFVYLTDCLFILAKQNAWAQAEKSFETHLSIVPNVKEKTQKGKLLGIHIRGKLSIGIIGRF
jgi:hypothetical protein